MATAAQSDPREELWKASFNTYYDSLFEELLADALITRWSFLDDLTKVLVAVTASGSAISGWALWNQPGTYKTAWMVVSAIAAFLSLVHTALTIPNRLKAHAEDKRRFATLRTELETFRYRMKIAQETFDITQFTEEFLRYRARFSENVELLCNDILRTSFLENSTQTKVDTRLQNEIEQS